ncbi:MAG: acetolactate decarboxylase [bacterium]
MRIIRYLSVTVFLVIVMNGCLHFQKNRDVLFQTSTINVLLEGGYDGEMTYEKLKHRGDFGIGTFNGLDGEMIGLEDKFYQVKADGRAYLVDDSMKTPFAVVTFFEPDKSALLDKAENYGQLEQHLDKLLPTENIFYAVKIEGAFKYIKTRSVPRQNKPYPLLVEVVKNQSTFEFNNVKGTIVGFWCPSYVEGINVPGYHLHFITEDRKAGGHLLECHLQNARIDVDYTSEFYMALLKSDEFYKMDLTGKKQKELEKVER